MEFKTNDNIKVYLTAMHIERTYEGLLEGKPNKKINGKIIDSLHHPADWSTKSHIYFDRFRLHNTNILPDTYVSLWLTGVTPEPRDIAISYLCNYTSWDYIHFTINNVTSDLQWMKNAQIINL